MPWLQFTPPGSGCSVQFGASLTTAPPGSAQGLMLTVSDMFRSARDLASAMTRAYVAHGEHEKCIGRADADWPDWYATYMVAEQARAELPR